jgi:hypothetical protein
MAAKKTQDIEQDVIEVAEVAEDESTVTAIIPHKFILNIDHHQQVQYVAGTQLMPRAHAEHKWSVANGVQIFKG